jgi:large subunit ribosomal protein L5
METIKQQQASAFETLKSQFGYKNKLAAPRVLKVVVSVGTGSGMKRDRNKNDFVIDRLAKITGQKPSVKSAKQSIASFKIRQGDPVGVVVTLRGARMWSFLEKLVHVALPRTKDFRGITRTSAGDLGNMTIGIREQVFGLAITVVTTAKTRPEGLAFFEHLGFPLKKEDEKKAKKTRKRGK